MKTLIIAAVAALPLVAGLAPAQATGGGHRLDCLQQRLDLSQGQREQMDALFEEQRAKRDALREEMRARMADILEPDQLAELETMQEARKERRMRRKAQGGKGRRGCGPGPAA